MRFLAAALLLATAATSAQTPTHKHPKDQLKFVLILSRHGVRPPLRTNDSLAQYATQPWPKWEVGLGQLTPHGAQALHPLGAWMRTHYAAAGLLPATGCESQSSVFLYADVDQRDMATDRALNEGMYPGCTPLPVFAVPQNKKDPLFFRSFQPAQDPSAAVASFKERIGDPASITARFQPTLDAFAKILAPDPAHPAKTSILSTPAAIVPGDGKTPGEGGASLRGPVFSATTLAEDIFLEYVNAKPMSDVGWGRVDMPTLRNLRELHAFAFRTSYGDGYVGRVENSSLLSHTLDTLEQASEVHSIGSLMLEGTAHGVAYTERLGAYAPPNKKLVVIAGHDDNLVAFGGMLGVHWFADGVHDETPPGAQFIFELYQNRRTHAQTVRLSYLVVPADDIRSAATLTGNHRPIVIPMKLPTCAAACPLVDFLRIARAAIDPHFILPTLAPAVGYDPPPAAPPAP